MTKMIFVNLPVKELQASVKFYEALGMKNNPQFSDDSAACMVWSDTIYIMLLTHDRWRTFTTRPIPSADSSEVMLALSCDDREMVDRLNELSEQHGGTADINPKQDLGFMYNRNVADLDGHVWEMFWMDPSAMQTS
ncbi:MAG: glyoxalase/bleomycin resistance/extradiol dioxygenase family protein [Planctomycetaceae bacterium]|nr:glyoxalase/bleomycin resistance/extradiol dioxygenase family protein [Planctomycetaceae bacterium]